MEITARINTTLNQVVISKKMTTFAARISVSDAKHLYNNGRITKTNKCFDRLVENDFDTKALLAWYQEERERLAKSATDES